MQSSSTRCNQTALNSSRFVLVRLVVCCMIALPARGQILTAADLQKETAAVEAASRKAEAPLMPPLQAGRVWSRLGSLYQDAARYGQAEAAYDRAIKLFTIAPVSQSDLAITIDRLGTLYLETGELGNAERAELHALKIRQAEGLASQLPLSWFHLANLYLRERHPAKAEDFARRAVEAFSLNSQAAPEDKVGSLMVLASSECQLHKYPEAIAHLNTALDTNLVTYGSERFPTGLNMFLLGYAYWKSGHAASARQPLERGYHILGKEIGGHPAYLFFMAHYLRDQHQPDEARVIRQEMKQKRDVLRADPALHDKLQTFNVVAFF